MRGAVVGVLVAFLTVSLAGCAGGNDPPTGDAGTDVFAGLEDEVEVVDGKGAISGIVVDTAIRPLGNVTVELIGAGTATTESNGAFVFEQLEPGTYFLRATAHRYETVQVSAVVEAGQVAAVRILMTPLTTAEPYHTTVQFHGHIENYLGTANFAVEVLAPGTLACTCTVDIPIDANVTTLLVEAFGEVAVPNPGSPATVPGDAYWELFAGPVADSALRASAYKEFPLYETFDGEELLEGAPILGVRITCGVWPCVTMDYDLFVTVWYHEEMPEGWTIVDAA